MKYLKVAGVLAALGLIAATTLVADVITAPPLSGNFALTLSGFEMFSIASGGPTFPLDLKGEGLVTADGNGNLAGNATITAAYPSAPIGGAAAAQCPGTVSGTVMEPGDGSAQIQLMFSPSTPFAPSGPDAQDACIATTIALNCVEEFPESVVPPVAVPLSSAQRKKHQPKPKAGGNDNANPPIVCSPNGTGAVIAFPYFLPSGAKSLKCVATSATAASGPASVVGASLAVELQQTPPASIVIPTPEPCPSPVLDPPGPMLPD